MFSSQTPAPLRLISQQTAFKSRFGFCWQIPRSGTTEFCQVPALHRKGVAESEGQAECSFTLPCPPRPPEPAAGESRRERCRQPVNLWGHGDNRGCGWQQTRTSLVSPNQGKGVACCKPQGQGDKGSAPPRAARSRPLSRAG